MAATYLFKTAVKVKEIVVFLIKEIDERVAGNVFI